MTGAAVVLAAGFSRRFGSDKRLFPIAGEPMVVRTVDRYTDVFSDTVVVVKPEDVEVQRLLAHRPVRIVIAEDAAEGMSRSLAAGVGAAMQADYVFIALADMPFVAVETLTELVAAAESAPGDSIVRPVHDGKPGHPVVFSSTYFAELVALEGDEGARAVVRKHAGSVIEVDVEDAGVLQDVDAPP